MRQHIRSRLGICLALVLGLSPIFFGRAGDASKSFKTQDYKGKVVDLASVLAKQGVKLDGAAALHWLALVRDYGTVYPLSKDEGTRMLFQDPVLRDRNVRLRVRRVGQTDACRSVSLPT